MTTLPVNVFLNITEETRIPGKTYQKNEDTEMGVANAAAPRKRSKKTLTVPHNSAWKLRCFLPVAAITITNSCLDIFKRRAVASEEDVKNGLSLKPIE